MDDRKLRIIIIISFIFSFFLISLLHEDNYSYGSIISQNDSIQVNDKSLSSEIVFKGLEFPTSMAFLNNDNILVLEKNNGFVKRIINGKMYHEPLLDLNVATKGERGLLGIAISDPDEKNNNKTHVFVYLTESQEKDGDDHNKGKPLGNRIYRYEYLENGTKLVNKKLLIDLPSGPESIHNGGKIRIGPDGNLYFTIGDLGDSNSQITNNKTGSKIDGRAGILRITQNGDPVKDDFTLGELHPMDKYYAYGIRNSFGLDFDPVTGKLWDTENGPRFGDEINLVEPGFNSGWSMMQGSRNNTNLAIEKEDLKDLVLFKGQGKYSPPEFSPLNNSGLTGLEFFDSSKLGKNYKDTIFVGDFHSGELFNFKLNDKRTSLILNTNGTKIGIDNEQVEMKPFVFAQGLGGIVDIQTGPDGYLYVLTLQYGADQCKRILVGCINYSLSNPGTIIKIGLK